MINFIQGESFDRDGGQTKGFVWKKIKEIFSGYKYSTKCRFTAK